MRKLTKAERAAAAAVLAMAASVAGAGITLLKRHTKLMAQKAASMFGNDDKPEEENAAETDDNPEENVAE